ncbi:MAG: energy-coupling factor transporter ATPase [Lachnospiraceae bacterium]|nr:energy-coupling factor transporter ATPase [Lachnospiraceae bacterium]
MLLELKDISYTYSAGTVYEASVLHNISLQINEGEFIAIIGHTGSGKSTLIQMFNALLQPVSGQVLYRGEDVWARGYNRKELRTHVGLVFQYPENQLFETDVLTDVEFGPKNQGLSKEECEERAKRALEEVGLPESSYASSPFELSGGQKRRVALAGVLAMDPHVLVLDEPTAGLDPAGRTELLDMISSLRANRGITVILVSHSMEDVASYASRLLVVDRGTIAYDGTPREVFTHYKDLETMGLAAPEVTYLMHTLKDRGFDADVTATTVAEARDSILEALKKRKGDEA